MRATPGLSSFAEDPEGLGGSLEELVDFARERVPREHWEKTGIRLMTTARLRPVEGRVQDRILESRRRVLRVSGFKFHDEWASVISGSDEGLYAWIVANYALGTLGGDSQKTTGIIELGGASVQVTFVSDDPIPAELSRIVKFGNFSYSLYSHSLLQYGQNVAFNLLWESLLTKGHKVAAESIQRGMRLDPCTPTTFLSNLSMAGEQFCEEYWSELKRKYLSLDKEDLLRYCFSSAYIVALLDDSLRNSFE